MSTISFCNTSFKVLIAVDASEASEQAFQFYFEHVHRPESGVILVHCPDKPSLPTFSWKSPGQYPAEEIAKAMKEHNKKAQEVEYKFVTDLELKHIPHKVKLVDSNEQVGQKLVKIAHEEKVDLIVMGSRNLNALMRTILHSVSDYVLHHAHVPVLVCPHH